MTNHKEKENIKSDFITIASHQLRTPISAIRWSLDTLLSGKLGNLSKDQKDVVEEAYQNNKFMIKTVNDLLRTARIDQKNITLQIKAENIVKIIQEAVKHLADLAQASNCVITIKPENKISKVYIDSLQLKPIIEGVIDNAIRYSKMKGRIHIILKTVKDYVVIKIKDNGIGIPVDQQDAVFTRFFRGRNAIKTQAEGIGLDLYITKQIIESLGGKIKFSSIENKGATFYLYLPTVKKVDDARLEKLRPEHNPENKVAEELKKEREFVSITVHELKAPLNITKWSLDMLKSKKPGELSEEQLELINQIYQGNERLLTLVRDLLNLAKLQQGKFAILPKSIDPKKMISDIIFGFKFEADKKQITLKLKQPKILPKITADSVRVSQIIINLLSNAIKYTSKRGKITITIQKLTGKKLNEINQKTQTADILNTDNKKGYLLVSIADTGIGISKEEQKKLFQRFFRGKNILKSKTEGTGLGLYITKSIINLHQGDIWFTSQKNKGSIFSFTIPIA